MVIHMLGSKVSKPKEKRRNRFIPTLARVFFKILFNKGYTIEYNIFQEYSRPATLYFLTFLFFRNSTLANFLLINSIAGRLD